MRVAIIITNPVIWGGDTILRLFDRYGIVRAHQLPMLQLLIAGVSMFSMDARWVQYMVAAIGALAGVGFYLVVADLFGEKYAFPAALLFITHPFLLAVSTVPFQEILMLAGLLFAFHFFYSEIWLAASACLLIACFTRFEAWAACPVLATAYFLRRHCGVTGFARGILLFGAAPMLWIAVRHGLVPSGHYVIEPHVSLARLYRYAYLAWITVKFTQLPVLLLAAAAAWRFAREPSQFDWRMGIQIAFLLLFAISILFSAHGVLPDPERYVTSREAFIPMYIVLLLAAAGISQWPRWNRAITVLSVMAGVAVAVAYVRTQSALPDAQLSYRTAQYLDRSLRPGEHALVLAAPVTGETARLYLEKAKETGGEEGLRQAEAKLRELSATPPNFERVVVQSHLPRSSFLTPTAGCAELLAVWNDYPDAGRALAGAQPSEVLRSGPLSVTIVRRSCP